MNRDDERAEHTSYFYWIDVMRIMAILAVILGHVSGVMLYKWGEVPLSHWMAANVADVYARTGPPLFFMLSGYLLLRKREETARVFFIKRLRRVFLPFVIWSLLYWLWSSLVQGRPVTFSTLWEGVVEMMFFRPAYFHFWFFYPLFGLYLLTPLLRRWLSVARRREVWYLVALWFLLGPVAQLITLLLDRDPISLVDYRFTSNIILASLGYFLLGYLLGDIHYLPWHGGAALLGVVGMVGVTAWGTYARSLRAGQVDLLLYDLYLPNTLLLTLSVFVVLKFIGDRLSGDRIGRIGRSVLRNLGASVFGVYLVHVMVLETLSNGVWGIKVSAPRLLYPYYTIPAYYSIPIVTVVVAVLSWLLVALLRRLPGLRVLMP
ncbi:MAG: hypothetical protein D6770_01155 [Anaerolineae bacterium]|nr:MAG: hypothetical protein D6770_01155 [Anaerolineae bacterium]